MHKKVGGSMVKYGEGLGNEVVKAVLNGEIIEPITYEKVKKYCNKNGILASENHMRVILSNASENTHSPTYTKYFERVGRGEYIVLPEHKPQPRHYYWLNVDSSYYDWSFSDLKIGRSQTYSNLNSNGNMRKNEGSFRNINIGDMVVAYETGKLKSITALCEVVEKLEENLEIFIEFKKISDFDTYLDIDSMKEAEGLIDCGVVNFHRGTLFQLEETHYNIITRMLREINSPLYHQEKLYNAVMQSKKDSSHERKKRLMDRTFLVPESYETTTRVFYRNPDVIVEVLLRANGICEKCKKTAPFYRAADGTPFLEVHHMKRLADGGEDTVANAVAVCPNCHRELHFG